MELNPECVRAVLKHLEEHTCASQDRTGKMTFVEIRGKQLSKEPSLLEQGFESDQIFYTAVQLLRGGMLYGEIDCGAPNEILILTITDLTWEGHELLKTIENDNVWNKTKDTAKKIGVFSIKAIAQIASQVLSSYITTALTGQAPL